MTIDEYWRTIRERFNPVAVEMAGWRVPRTIQLFDELRANLKQPDLGKFLIAGPRGAGKTVALLKLGDERVPDDQVFFFDIYQHFVDALGNPAALENVQPWEVAVLIALAVYRGMQDQYGNRWKEGAALLDELNRRWNDLLPPAAPQSRIPIGQLVEAVSLLVSPVDATAGTLTVLGKVTGAVWDRHVGRNRPASDQDPRALAIVESVDALLSKATEVAGRRVLVLLDGLDRIDDPKASRRLFSDSVLLARLPVALVATTPLSARLKAGSEKLGYDVQLLPNEEVLDKNAPTDRERLGPGLDFMSRLVQARWQDLQADLKRYQGNRTPPALVESDALRRLAWSSGGNPRNFVALVHSAAKWARNDNRWAIRLSDAEAAITDDTDKRIDILRREDVEVLKDVKENREKRLPDDPRIDELLAAGLLLPYRNGKTWYFPHPLTLSELG